METKNDFPITVKNFLRIVVTSSILFSSFTLSASFDCNNANSKIEKLICNDEYLSTLDTEMSDLYFLNLREITHNQEKEELKTGQIKWLKTNINRCSTADCLKKEYRIRTAYFKYLIAHRLYKNNEMDKAKPMLIELAEINSDASSLLRDSNILSDEEYIDYIIEKISAGHKRVIDNELDYLFYRSGQLNTSNPIRAYKLFSALRDKGLTTKVYEADAKFSTLSKCYETADFNPTAFATIHSLDLNSSSWELAEEASKTNKFGTPNPKLILALVCRGGFVPKELEFAVDEAYSYWKQNKVLKFNPCDYATSNITLGYCQSKK